MSLEGISERLDSGLSYSEYLDNWRKKLQTPMAGLDKATRKVCHYARYNMERHDRVAKQYVPSDDLTNALASIDSPQEWMVLVEEWCGDAAFAMPIIGAAAAASEHVRLRILHRDENLDLMDRYLTNGSRSIPKLVAFDEDGAELFQWGPRPAVVQAAREQLVRQGHESAEIVLRLVEMYEDGTWIETDGELARLIAASVATAA